MSERYELQLQRVREEVAAWQQGPALARKLSGTCLIGRPATRATPPPGTGICFRCGSRADAGCKHNRS